MNAKKFFSLALLAASGLAVSSQAQTTNTIATWTFETSAPTTSGPLSPEIGSGSALGFHASSSAVYTTPSGNGSAHSWSSTFWAQNDYYQFSVDTTGNSGIQFAYDQNGSASSPKTWQLFYSTDGSTFNNFGSTYTIPSGITWTAGTSFSASHFSDDLTLIGALNNNPTVVFRIVDESPTTGGSISGGNVNTAGTDRVDNVSVFVVVPEPSTMALLGLGAAGLFFFRRRH